MEGIDNFYDKVFGKDSALFIGTLWLGMIAKHMDDVRKAEDDAYEFMGEFIFRWLNKLRTLYDNVEFKTDIPRYKEKIKFNSLKFNRLQNKYIDEEISIEKSKKFIIWFEKIKLLMEISRRLPANTQMSKLKLTKEHNILLEVGDCQREFYMEIEKKHLIMPPERESMKDLTKSEWIDRKKPKFDKEKKI